MDWTDTGNEINMGHHSMEEKLDTREWDCTNIQVPLLLSSGTTGASDCE
jgi:hypothetical protein